MAGALAFAYGGAALWLASWSPMHIGPYAWMPVALAALERLLRAPSPRRGACLGIVLTLQLLPGFPQISEHLYFFGRQTMRAVLARHGFEVLSIRSIGHTFDLGFLLERLTLYNEPVFRALRRAVTAVGLGSLQIYLNPFTKMIVFARRRAEP